MVFVGGKATAEPRVVVDTTAGGQEAASRKGTLFSYQSDATPLAVFMSVARILALCCLLAGGAASAEEGVRLVAQPDIAPRIAAFPRLAPDEPQAARINEALAAADARARAAADDCRSQSEGSSADPGTLGWTRSIAIAMRGPYYLALVTDDYSYCGGLHPNADSIALTYDLRSGQPPNWSRLLPKALVREVSVESAMDETPLGMVASQALKALYLASARRAAQKVAPDCMDVLRQSAGPFMLWPDARQGSIVVQPSRLAHAFAACGVPALIGIDVLRRQGVSPALLQAVATAHRVGDYGVPRSSRPAGQALVR